MVVRGVLGVLVSKCLGAGCLAVGMAGFVEKFLVVSCSLIFFCLYAMMPRSLVWASRQSLLRRVGLDCGLGEECLDHSGGYAMYFPSFGGLLFDMICDGSGST